MSKFIRKNKIILLALGALVAYISFVLVNQEIKYRELIAEREAYMQQIDALGETIEDLNQMIEEISTPEYIEKMARERLQMVKSDEVIYILEEQND